MPETKQRGNVKIRVGRVLSNKMDKTIVVGVERLMEHKLYRKRMRLTKRLYAHDEQNTCNVGDLVKLIETRPMSRNKHWRVSEVLERAK